MKTSSSFSRRVVLASSTVLILATHVAQACPGCKQVVENGNTGMNGRSIGFSLGVLFMIGMVTAVLGGLAYMMARYARVIAAQHQAMMEQEDALHGLA